MEKHSIADRERNPRLPWGCHQETLCVCVENGERKSESHGG